MKKLIGHCAFVGLINFTTYSRVYLLDSSWGIPKCHYLYIFSLGLAGFPKMIFLIYCLNR